MLLSFWLFEDSFTHIVTITFSSLIIIEILNTHTVISHFNKIVFVSQIFTLLIYFGSIMLFRDQIDVAAIDLVFLQKVAIIVLVAWGPIQVIKVLRKKFDPTESERIMKTVA
jgi:phospholipid-translocating ATPase